MNLMECERARGPSELVRCNFLDSFCFFSLFFWFSSENVLLHTVSCTTFVLTVTTCPWIAFLFVGICKCCHGCLCSFFVVMCFLVGLLLVCVAALCVELVPLNFSFFFTLPTRSLTLVALFLGRFVWIKYECACVFWFYFVSLCIWSMGCCFGFWFFSILWSLHFTSLHITSCSSSSFFVVAAASAVGSLLLLPFELRSLPPIYAGFIFVGQIVFIFIFSAMFLLLLFYCECVSLCVCGPFISHLFIYLCERDRVSTHIVI